MKRVAIALAAALWVVGLAHAETAKTQTQTTPTHQHGSTTTAPAAKAATPAKPASETHAHGMDSMSPGPSKTITGELVDLGCYLGHGAKGAAHKDCAAKCISGGMPMGVLTPEGQLYLLTMSHSNGDPYAKAKDMAAETVKVTGPVSKRDGMQAIQVDAVEMVAAKAPAAGAKG